MNISTGCEVTALEPFLMRQNSVESIEHPAWSPDGEWLYYSYSHVTQTATQATFNRTLERINIKSGAIEAISADAIWPTVSANNGAIAFVKFASVLHQSAPNGTNLQTLLQAAPFVAIDAPTFTPDGRFIFFSAATSTTTPAWSLDLWFRPQVAEAHNYPSDWWRLDLKTGTLQPISNLLLTQLNGDVSPDGQWLAFNSSVGVFNMQANGTALEQILRPNTVDTVLPLSLEWIP
jgi:Tol biopolymer transport system component